MYIVLLYIYTYQTEFWIKQTSWEEVFSWKYTPWGRHSRINNREKSHFCEYRSITASLCPTLQFSFMYFKRNCGTFYLIFLYLFQLNQLKTTTTHWFSFFLIDRVSLFRSEQSRIHYINQAGLKPIEMHLPLSLSAIIKGMYHHLLSFESCFGA